MCIVSHVYCFFGLLPPPKEVINGPLRVARFINYRKSHLPRVDLLCLWPVRNGMQPQGRLDAQHATWQEEGKSTLCGPANVFSSSSRHHCEALNLYQGGAV